MKRIYLDYASITPLDPKVFRAMRPYIEDVFQNPSSLYKEGRVARQAIDDSRKKIAHVFQSKPQEIIFTSGGTEANNIAILGTYEGLNKKGKIHMITSAIEHSSVLEAFKELETKGVDVTYLSTSYDGKIRVDQLLRSIRRDTKLISLMYGNNEIGTINDIALLIKEARKYAEKKGYKKITFHTDASQGACYLNIRADYLGADLITTDSTKLYGPRGCGALFVKNGTKLRPIIFGGGQESGIRAGTENVAAIVGISNALELCQKERRDESKRLTAMRDKFIDRLIREVTDIKINGSRNDRLPNNINFCVKGLDSEFLVIKLDQEGIACSSATTCLNLSEDSSSYVVHDINKECSRSSIRITLGRYTTNKELDQGLKIIIKNIKKQLDSLTHAV